MADDFAVHLQLAPDKRSVRPARSVAASLGVDVGMDLDELDDLRVAVQEALALVIAHTDQQIEMVVEPQGATIHVAFSCTAEESLAGPGSLARQLLDVLVAQHGITSMGTTQTIWLESHPAANAG